MLAKLGEIGKNNNIEFISIVPKEVRKFVKAGTENNIEIDKDIDLIIDPLLVEGTKKYIIDFTFKTEFINFLNFLRELEFQENVVLLNDINIKLLNQITNNGEVDDSLDMLEVKLNMAVYGKI